jgi:hypothetical protein
MNYTSPDFGLQSMQNWGNWQAPTTPAMGMDMSGWSAGNVPAYLLAENGYQMSPQTSWNSFTSGLSNTLGDFGSGVSEFMNGDFMKGALGYKDANGVQQQGWGAPLLGAISGIGQSWLGMQQLDLARDQFALKKDLAMTNLANQQKLTNASLEDRQRARLGANPTGYQSVGDYMKKNGV